MAKGLNKHTPDSEELFKRLEQNDPGGLDDFEKEALEGFDALDNIELAKELNASLNKKIDEKYFKKEGGKSKTWMYLSMAAGLVLVVGLSIFFMNIMGDKKEMALEAAPTSETIANEVANPTDLAPSEPKTKTEETKASAAAGGDATVTNALAEKSGTTLETKVPADADRREKNQPDDKDDGLRSRMIVKEKKTDVNADNNKVADSEGEYYKQETDKLAAQGPPSGNVAANSPVVAEDQKTSPVQTSSTTKGKEEKESLSKNNNAPRNDLAMEKSGKTETKKSEAPGKKAKTRAQSGEALGNEDAVSKDETNEQTVNQTTAVGGVATGTKRDESGYVHNIEYSNHAYSKPQDYIKTEISKSEMLKTNVKAFKAELTINDKGTVTEVKFLTPFENCTGCKKELEKILLNMPGWKPSATKKAVKETVSYIDN